MAETAYPVTVAVRRDDGSIEHVRVGTAYRSGEGFSLKLGELTIGAAQEASRAAPSRAAPAPSAYQGGGYSGGGYSGGGGGGGGGEPTVFPNYGRSKGGPIAGATMEDLEYYAAGAKRTLNDASKSRWHDKERALLAAIEAEMTRQGQSPQRGPRPRPTFDEGPRGGPPEPPPHSDEDIPF